MANQLPYISESVELMQSAADDRIIIDLGSSEEYRQGHVPGAVHLDYRQLRTENLPVAGLVPPIGELVATLTACGISATRDVVAYDHANGAAACRLLWTLDLLGHSRHTLLNGGMHAWRHAGLPISMQAETAPAAQLTVAMDDSVIADRDYVLGALGNPEIQIVDARTPAEFVGLQSASQRRGRIPGAVNLHWLDTIDPHRQRRLLPAADLERMVTACGLQPAREIIVHCQTHQRSSHSYIMLKSLGFPRVRGYAGSWAEWASDPDLPIIQGP